MKYAKLENGMLRYAPATIMWQGRSVNNPSCDKLLQLGYKPVIYTEKPSGNYSPAWQEEEKEILQIWNMSEIEGEDAEELEPPSVEERLEALELALLELAEVMLNG